MLEAARVAREKRQRVKQLHFMKCPKCGHDLAERDLEGVTVDQCSFCADGASGLAYVFLANVDSGKVDVARGGIYEDVLVKTQDGWRFKRRTSLPRPATFA